AGVAARRGRLTVPVTWVPLHVTAALVGYARVHTGVHYPSDVVAGSLVGAMCGWTVRRAPRPWSTRTRTRTRRGRTGRTATADGGPGATARPARRGPRAGGGVRPT